MRVLSFLILAMFLFIVGCSEDSDDGMSADMGKYTLALSFNGAEPLQNGYFYEGWAIVNGAPLSTGQFNINSSGVITDLNGNVITNGEFTVSQDLSSASAIVITIEPAGDTDPNPADTHVLAGDVAASSAALTVGHGAALGDDFLLLPENIFWLHLPRLI